MQELCPSGVLRTYAQCHGIQHWFRSTRLCILVTWVCVTYTYKYSSMASNQIVMSSEKSLQPNPQYDWTILGGYQKVFITSAQTIRNIVCQKVWFLTGSLWEAIRWQADTPSNFPLLIHSTEQAHIPTRTMACIPPAATKHIQKTGLEQQWPCESVWYVNKIISNNWAVHVQNVFYISTWEGNLPPWEC